MAISTFKYANSTDLRRVFSRVDEYDTKQPLYNWATDNSLYVCYDSGNTSALFLESKNQQSGKQTIGTTALTTINEGAEFTATDTTLTVTDGTKITNNDYILIDSEILRVTAIATNDLTVVRGELGTNASAHTDGSNILQHFSPISNGDWLYDSNNDFVILKYGSDPNDLITESGVDVATLIDDILENASQELNTMLDARFPTPIPKAFLYSADPSNDAPQYDPIIVRATCYIASANLIRANDPLSDEAQRFYELVTNADGTGLLDEVNSGKRKLNFEIDKTDKSGNIIEVTRTGTMYLVETYGNYGGGLYDRIQCICSTTGGVYGTAKIDIKTYNGTQLYGTTQSDVIVTGGLQAITGGIYARWEGNSMTVGDRWDIEVRGSGLQQSNSAVRSIPITRTDGQKVKGLVQGRLYR